MVGEPGRESDDQTGCTMAGFPCSFSRSCWSRAVAAPSPSADLSDSDHAQVMDLLQTIYKSGLAITSSPGTPPMRVDIMNFRRRKTSSFPRHLHPDRCCTGIPERHRTGRRTASNRGLEHHRQRMEALKFAVEITPGVAAARWKCPTTRSPFIRSKSRSISRRASAPTQSQRSAHAASAAAASVDSALTASLLSQPRRSGSAPRRLSSRVPAIPAAKAIRASRRFSGTRRVRRETTTAAATHPQRVPARLTRRPCRRERAAGW